MSSITSNEVLPISPESSAGALEKYARVSEIDPLDVDHLMEKVPEYNSTGSVEDLKEIIASALERAPRTESMGECEALACLRDLDFLAASILRHGGNPFEVAGLEAYMLACGQTAGTIPRGTVFTYAIGNPTGQRRRRFTDTAAEEAFIEATTEACKALDESVIWLAQVNVGGEDDKIAGCVSMASCGVKTCTRAMRDVHSRVDPAWFSSTLRPYFDPLLIDGQKYLAPGGAQLPFLALDFILWGADAGDDFYDTYFRDNLPYCDPAYRCLIDQYYMQNDGYSIARSLLEAREGFPTVVREVVGLYGSLRSFRSIHRLVAQRSFSARAEESVGSGGSTPAMLDRLYNLTIVSQSAMKDGANHD